MNKDKLNVSGRISALLFIVLALLSGLELLLMWVPLPINNLHKLLIYIVLFFLPIFIYIKVCKYKTSKALKLRHVKIKYAPFIILFSLSVSFICAIINAFSMWIGRMMGFAGSTDQILSVSGTNPLTIILILVILPAVAEELLLRGVALYEYRKYGVAVSIIMTSVLFALFHINIQSFLSLLAAGVFYAVLTLLFDSVYPAIIAHLINNALSVFTSYNLAFVRYILADSLFAVLLALIIFGVLFSTLKMAEGVIDSLGNKNRLHTDTTKLAYGDPLKSIWLWLFVLLSISMMVINIIL